MKKFRFPLRPVGILREHHKARTREIFAAAVHEFVEAESRLAAKRAERHDLEVVMHDGRRATFKASEEISFWTVYRRICDEEVGAEKVVLAARTKMEEARQKYLEAHRAVKVVEKLEEKARTQHRAGVEREAQNESDEQAGLRVARRVNSAPFAST